MAQSNSSESEQRPAGAKVRQLSRRDARRKAFELLFELEQHAGLAAGEAVQRSFEPEVEQHYLTDEDAEGYAAGRASPGNQRFIQTLVEATANQRPVLDAELARYPVEWSYERLGQTERVLLRMALAEILFVGTPHKVAINEVIELAKLYADDEAARFVNGILGSAVSNLERLRLSMGLPPPGADRDPEEAG